MQLRALAEILGIEWPPDGHSDEPPSAQLMPDYNDRFAQSIIDLRDVDDALYRTMLKKAAEAVAVSNESHEYKGSSSQQLAHEAAEEKADEEQQEKHDSTTPNQVR